MTLDYNVVIPMTVTVALSYAVRKLLSKESIYSAKLVRRGHAPPEALQANLQGLKKAHEVMERNMMVMPAPTTLRDAMSSIQWGTTPSLIVVEDGEGALYGIVPSESLLIASTEAGGQRTLGEIASRNFATIVQDATLFDVMSKMRSDGVPVILVVDDAADTTARGVKGFIVGQQVGQAVVETIDPFLH
jgi:chloride channel protein, CIC family